MNVADRPFVSVVTPVYNTGAYLAKCIESVLAQSYREFEYVIVNNCSTDDSRTIAQHYADLDNRIRIVDNATFLTQAQNYNHALRQISTKSHYCKIVEADNWLFPSCLEEMVQLAEQDSRIAIVGAYQLYGTHVLCQGLECASGNPPYTVVQGRDACRMFFLEHRYLFGTPTCLLYRSALVQNRYQFYREDSQFEDSEVCFEVLGSYLFGFVHQVLTFTRVGNPSISTGTIELGAWRLHDYLVTKLYGPFYLDTDEQARALTQKRDFYYRMLAQRSFRLRDERFWEYHKNGLRMVGDVLDKKMLMKLRLRRLLDLVGNPLSTLESTIAWLRTKLGF